MKIKILILTFICLFIFVCCKSPADPDIARVFEDTSQDQEDTSQEEKDSTLVYFELETHVNGDDVWMSPPNYNWKVIVEFYVDNQLIGEAGLTFCAGWNSWTEYVTSSTSYQVGKKYGVKFKFKYTDVPVWWEESLWFRLCVNVRTVDRDFKIEGEHPWTGWKKIGTEFFTKWKVGLWHESPTSTADAPYIFRILQR